jgi:hypothetical protein
MGTRLKNVFSILFSIGAAKVIITISFSRLRLFSQNFNNTPKYQAISGRV